MRKKVVSICKSCGAVGKKRDEHCILCGASLDRSMWFLAKKKKFSAR